LHSVQQLIINFYQPWQWMIMLQHCVPGFQLVAAALQEPNNRHIHTYYLSDSGNMAHKT